jgi:hypothetical protein
MKKAELFEKKYGLNPIEFIRKVYNKHIDLVKRLGLEELIAIELQSLNKPEPDTEFYKLLIENFAEANEVFPERKTIFWDAKKLGDLEVFPVNPTIPKGKGALENFKDVVGKDELRPVLMGVYVDGDKLIGTNAHILGICNNSSFKEYSGKIINLEKYIKTKGDVIDFIDGRFPDYEQVIPNINLKKTEIDVYAFYNYAKSTIFLNKLSETENYIVCRFRLDDLEFYFNPKLLALSMEFLFRNNCTKATLEYTTPDRSFNFVCDKASILIMPLMGSKQELPNMEFYTIKELEAKFGSGKTGVSKPSGNDKPRPHKKLSEKIEYKKYSGDIKTDTIYIPRRDIRLVILNNGEELNTNDIVDGLYRVKKYATGGKFPFKDTAILDDIKSYLEETLGGTFTYSAPKGSMASSGIVTFRKRGGNMLPMGSDWSETIEIAKRIKDKFGYSANVSQETINISVYGKVDDYYAEGGVIKTIPAGQEYRYVGSNSIEKDIMGRIEGQLSGLKFAGNFDIKDWKRFTSGYLYFLDEFDKDFVKDVPLKKNEMIFRYYTRVTAIGGMIPLVKINLESGLMYFNEATDFGDESIRFSRKGERPMYLNLVEGLI